MQNSTTPFSIAMKRQAEVRQASNSRRGREQQKRERLRAELAHELEQPLTPSVTLSKTERQAEIDRVHTGAIRQSVWPRSGNGRTAVGEF